MAVFAASVCSFVAASSFAAACAALAEAALWACVRACVRHAAGSGFECTTGALRGVAQVD